jgi:hypothetical protein
VKKSNKYSANARRRIVEVIGFEEAEAEKLELVKKHMSLKQNEEVIKALISEKCDNIKRIEEEQRKQKIAEAKAMDHLEKSEYECPM